MQEIEHSHLVLQWAFHDYYRRGEKISGMETAMYGICKQSQSQTSMEHIQCPVSFLLFFLCEQSDPHKEAGRFDQRLFY
jgi:hypothetical protein